MKPMHLAKWVECVTCLPVMTTYGPGFLQKSSLAVITPIITGGKSSLTNPVHERVFWKLPET